MSLIPPPPYKKVLWGSRCKECTIPSVAFHSTNMANLLVLSNGEYLCAWCHCQFAAPVAQRMSLYPVPPSKLGLPSKKSVPENQVIPDSTEPFLAYRHFQMTAGGLQPPYHKGGSGGVHTTTWHPGECLSYCSVGMPSRYSDVCTSPGCACGFYAVWSDDHQYAVSTNYHNQMVFGVIECYGKVKLGPHGCRASKARIVALHLPPVPRWTPQFSINQAIMEAYDPEGTKFYRSRLNLINAMGVKTPTNLIENIERFSQFG